MDNRSRNEIRLNMERAEMLTNEFIEVLTADMENETNPYEKARIRLEILKLRVDLRILVGTLRNKLAEIDRRQ